MESLKAALQHFVDHFAKTASIYTTIIVIFSYHVVLEKDFACTCKKQKTDCWLYMILPTFLIFVIMLWRDKRFQGALKYCCKCIKNLCCILVYQLFKAVLLGSLWAASVLIDGDWYVCCYNDHSEQQEKLPCKDKTNITDEERGIITELKNKSRVIGLPLLLCVTFVAACLSSLPSKKRLRDCCCKCCCHCSEGPNPLKIDEIILEEEHLMIKKVKEAVKQKLNHELDICVTKKQFGKCFDVAGELIYSGLGDPNPPSRRTSQSPLLNPGE